MAIAEGASALAYDDLPAPARALARQCVLDYLGVALAGAADPLRSGSCSTRWRRPARLAAGEHHRP